MNEPPDPPPTEVAVLTAAGRAAIAVVRVSGPGSTVAVDHYFRAANNRPLADQPLDAIRFGRWRRGPDDDPAAEELVVCRTSDTTVEVHCHGGDAAAGAIVADLVARGGVERSWREALASATGSVIETEARLALADCVTDRAAGVLLDQLNGALERSVRQAIESLIRGDNAAAVTQIDELLARWELGRRLAAPWRVVLAGPPNVGKSSLINALVGYERAVVFDQPGVTRDVVTAAAAIDGWPVELADTAGLRPATDELESAGVGLAREAIRAADLVVMVDAFDPAAGAWRPPAPEEIPAPRVLRAVNKIDLAGDGCRFGDEVQAVSATRGDGIAALVDAIGAALVPEPPAAGAAVPFTARQIACLRGARSALDQNQTANARDALLAVVSPESPPSP